jgi:hypothetical protein
LCVLETFQSYRATATAVNPLKSQDFHLISTMRGGYPVRHKAKTFHSWDLFTARPKTRFHFDSPQNPAHAEAEDDAKIKDRLEALLFAETLQGTLSPNANPGKGVSWRLTDLDAESHREDSAGSSDTPVTCPRLDLLYQTSGRCARGESKKLLAVRSGGF